MRITRLSQLVDEARAICLDLPPDSNRHISFIFNKQRLISIGANYGKSTPEPIRRGYYSPVPHSELRAFMKVPYTQREDLTLVNFRFNKKGELRISRPCSKCKLWVDPIFKHVYFSDDSGMYYDNRRSNIEELVLQWPT